MTERRFYISLYDEGADEMCQIVVEDGERAVRAAAGGWKVDTKPLLNCMGKPYPVRPEDARERYKQRETEIHARLGVPAP